MRFRFLPTWLLEPDGEEVAPQGDVSGSVQATEDSQMNPADALVSNGLAEEAFVTIRFETYSKDVRQVWMEIASLYPPRNGLNQDLNLIGNNIKQTHYLFLTEKGKRFLDKFDVA